MTSKSLSPLQRILVIVAAAILLPAVMVVAFVFRELSLGEMRDVERRAQEAADLIIVLADSRSRADITALRVLSQSRYFTSDDFAAGSARAKTTLDLIPTWKAVTLKNARTGDIIFQVTQPDVTSENVAAPSQLGSLPESGFGGVQRDGPLCPCLDLQVPVTNSDLVLTANVDPQFYQNLVLERLPAGSVAALVDRKGNFIARSVDYEERVGTPGTQFVLDAVAKGGRGIYQGTTYEGLTNYTAYTTSALTGWSAHVAVNNTLFDGPRSAANTALVLGSLAAILIGAALFVYVLRDIAARRLEDRRMMELQKAEAVQQFTSTVVHDFRNITSAVRSGLRMIARQTNEPATLKHTEMIDEVVERGLRLTNRLLSFVRKEASEVEDFDVKDLLAEIHYLLDQAAGQRAQVVIEVPETPVTVRASREQLELALVNLVGNARDAMNGNGLITVSAAVNNDEVLISVADTGPGIPLDMRAQVLQPFFTTKPDGCGTGLGLAQVANMVREAGGDVEIGEANGGGALITLHMKR